MSYGTNQDSTVRIEMTVQQGEAIETGKIPYAQFEFQRMLDDGWPAPPDNDEQETFCHLVPSDCGAADMRRASAS
jgi:hypothetical protein